MYLIIFVALILLVGYFLTRGPARSRSGLVMTVSVVLAGLLVLYEAILIVPSEKIAVQRLFGKTEPGFEGPGLHIVNPLANYWQYEALRREFTIEGPVMASDNNTMNLETGFATKLNPVSAYRIQELVGYDYFEKLVNPAGQTAVRSAAATFTWDQASTSKRGEFQNMIQKNFEEVLVEQLVASGLDPAEAKTALIIFPVQIRRSLPDAKVQNAVAEKTAAQQDLARQQTLTSIAEQEALRRKNEGTGVKNLFEELPTGFNANEIATVLSALATKTRADALLKAVESGQVGSIVMNGDSSAPLAIQAPIGRPTQQNGTATIGNRPGIDPGAQ